MEIHYTNKEVGIARNYTFQNICFIWLFIQLEDWDGEQKKNLEILELDE